MWHSSPRVSAKPEGTGISNRYRASAGCCRPDTVVILLVGVGPMRDDRACISGQKNTTTVTHDLVSTGAHVAKSVGRRTVVTAVCMYSGMDREAVMVVVTAKLLAGINSSGNGGKIDETERASSRDSARVDSPSRS